MVVFSGLRPILFNKANLLVKNGAQRSMSGHNTFPYQPSRFQWTKFKDLFHYYVMLGVIPVGLIVTYVNIFIGPATLSEIPEGYTPKHWEYFRHPITRFISKYLVSSPQEDYEKYLHHIFEEDEKSRMRKLEKDVETFISQRNDYQAYYYRPVLAKYHRISKEAADYLESLSGD
ncbi:NADH dehydrogenase [ubiquinone] 1 beta subcomplex subunit 5, mitochondrial-like [Onthophagus taurus]|uniref:NADH dehydrogenase [ubiquinone] 1 beta subcomplex subunit 5, mitochondrial-like n=1 Tax=Onthophagus taurus TaxID=166361 RepID=UPI000C20ED89|nr:NADH dehydrogenase [ubiquinone] 1 beta subcomplex subunit 5, mitochondrial-like [Onthophagus taurus]XP_022911990.1 NADH dehydrogenase [ubiquinone] 1 beta subcomplex subunit 5, mitochondrial-like [Onthophagus taurus]